MFRLGYTSIRARLVAAFILVTAVASLIAAGLAIAEVRRSMGAAIQEALSSQARSIYSDVQRYLEEKATHVRHWSRSAVMDNVLIDDANLELMNFLLEMHSVEPDFALLTVIDEGGRVVASTDPGSVGRPCPIDIERLSRIGDSALRAGELPAPPETSDATLVLAHPLRSELAQGDLGWIIAVTRWEPVRRILRLASTSGAHRSPTLVADLVDEEGRVFMSGSTGSPPSADPDRDRFLTAMAGGSGPGLPLSSKLRVRVRMRRSEAKSAGRGQILGVLLASLAGLVSAAGAGVLVAHGMSRRIHQVAEGARRFAEDRLERPVPEQGHDEIAMLAGSFNRMARQLSGAHEDLARAAARWRSLVENAPDIIVTLRPDGTLDFVNHVLPGYRMDMVLGTNLYDWLAPEHRSNIRSGVEQVFRTGAPLSFEVKGAGPHGGIAWYSMRLGPIIRDGRPQGVTLIATDITERRRLEQEILEVAERERRRIGLDLHDGLGQSLTGTALICRSLAGRLAERGAEEAPDAKRVGSLLQDAIAKTRAIARGLYPLDLDTRGLRGALENLVSSVDNIPGVTCTLTGEAPPEAFTPNEATHLFRIAQEAVLNALRHGSARNLIIRIDAGPDGRGLRVMDDGRGLPPNSTEEGLGFRLMRYRAGIIGGTFSVGRGESGGTIVQCSL